MSNSKVWFVNAQTRMLTEVLAQQPDAIKEAQAFTFSLLSVYVDKDYDGFLRGGNDIFISTSIKEGSKPDVERFHYFKRGIEAKTAIGPFDMEVIYTCEDFKPNERILLTVKVQDIDKGKEDRAKITERIQGVLEPGVPLFPILGTLAKGSQVDAFLKVANDIWDMLEDNQIIMESKISFVSELQKENGIFLNPGKYVIFNQQVDASACKLNDGVLVKPNGENVAKTYAVISLIANVNIDYDTIVMQKEATLLTQVNNGNEDTHKITNDFLYDTVKNSDIYNKAKRFIELKAKAVLTAEEQKLLDYLQGIDGLKEIVALFK